jgi:flagellar biosynthetic protein FlhB
MRQRQIRNELAKKGMKAKVPEASFVVANPTHFAIAFKYETGMHAPICLAKGIDFLALEIRKIAEENNIAVVEDPPLARMLYKIVEVDQEIPVEVYKPVAEVVGYVMRLKARRARQKQR